MPADDFARRHLTALANADADEAADLYADDATMLSLEWTAESHDAIRDRYRRFFDYHGEVEEVSLDRSQQASDLLFTEFTMRSTRGRFQLVNAFVLRDRKARHHFSNVVDLALDEDEVQEEVS